PQKSRPWLAFLPPPARAFDGALLAATLASIRFGILFWLGTALTTKLSSLFSGHQLEHTPHDTHAHDTHAHDTHAHDTHAHDTHAHERDTSRDSAKIHVALPPHGAPPNHPTPAASLAATASPIVREYIAWTLTGLVLYALLTAALAPDALGVL